MNFTTEKNRIYYEADGKLLAEITFIDSNENSMASLPNLYKRQSMK